MYFGNLSNNNLAYDGYFFPGNALKFGGNKCLIIEI